MNKNSYIKKHIEFNKDELETEVWVDIEGYDYEYQISNLGRFKSKTAFHSNLIDKTRLGSFNKNGYLRVNLTKKGKPINKKIHRLVAEHFLIDYEETLTVNHKDFVKNNNRVSNIEMLSVKDNVLHFIENEVKLNSSSKVTGICYHVGISKWIARVNFEDIRYFLGAFLNESDAIEALKNFNSTLDKSLFKVGKGSSNLGRSKYSQQDDLEALSLSKEVGVRKAGKITGMGSTRISMLRRKYK